MARRGSRSSRGGRAGRGGRSSRADKGNEDIPDVYREMLAEATSTDTHAIDESRPRKRPKIAGKHPQANSTSQTTTSQGQPEGDDVAMRSSPVAQNPVQTVVDESQDSDSDMEFEDIEIGDGETQHDYDQLPHESNETLSIVVKEPSSTHSARNARRRKPATSAEKSMRLDIHKMHMLYLLYYGFFRNNWCNDIKAQACSQLSI